ncbi:MAG: hypothetical protein ACR2RF_14355 [Geminicoccaceae bacterium]
MSEPTVIERMAVAYVREQRPCPPDEVEEYACATYDFMLAAVRELQVAMIEKTGSPSVLIQVVIDAHEIHSPGERG